MILNLKFKVETSNPNSFQSGTFGYLQIPNCYFYVVCTVYIFEDIGEFAHSLFSVMQRSEPRIPPSNSCLENWPKPKIWFALRGHYVWILKKNWKFHPIFLYFLLNDTWIHLVSDNICFLRLFIHAPLKNSRFWRPAHCLFFGCHAFFVFLVAMATTSNPIVLARFIPPKWFKNSFDLILRPLSPAPDLLS